jgi:hypothetical protein
MLFGWHIDLSAFFPAFEFLVSGPDAAGKILRQLPKALSIIQALDLGSLGQAGIRIGIKGASGGVTLAFVGAGIWAIDKLLFLPSGEIALLPERSGVVHGYLDSKDAALLAAGTKSEQNASQTADESQQVNMAAFSPPVVAPGDDFYVQVVLFSPEELADAVATAAELDPGTQLARCISLRLPLRKGDQVRITLSGHDAEVDEPEQIFPWQGSLAHVAFLVRVPVRLGGRDYKPLIRIFINDTPFGIMGLKIKAAFECGQEPPIPVAEKAWPFNEVFLSYASPDRLQVLQTAQTLRALKINFFQDLLSLEPGQRWKQEIYKRIETCDVLFLFWSSHAKKSKWVIREAKLALECQKKSSDNRPYITPMILEPKLVKPPKELSEIHFGDPLQNVIFAEKVLRAKDDQLARLDNERF